VKLSAAVYAQPKKPHVALNDCIVLPEGITTEPCEESDGDAIDDAPNSVRHRNAPVAPSHTPRRVSLFITGAAATTPVSGSTIGAVALEASSGVVHFTTPVWPTTATSDPAPLVDAV